MCNILLQKDNFIDEMWREINEKLRSVIDNYCFSILHSQNGIEKKIILKNLFKIRFVLKIFPCYNDYHYWSIFQKKDE